MCLVIYPDTLPTHIHNTIMTILESAPGQQSPNLADVLHRNLLPDGRVILQALHNEGMLKKINTNQVIVTPTAQSNVKLDELNRIVKELESGADALKRIQELDANAGFVDPVTKRKSEKAFKAGRITEAESLVAPLVAPATGALDDQSLAANMLAQAKKMEVDAKGLVAEAARMKKEAQKMFPAVNMKSAKTVPVATAVEPVAAKTRSRKKAAADAVQ
jgi:predicted fused transcriptional regulator/phosphomethylpyrimidine kinase